MRILIATDKFKGSLTGPEVADALASGLTDHEVETVPVADGGEGTVDAALAVGFTERRVSVTGPTGESVAARFAVNGGEAVIEMAAASGLDVLPDGTPAPLTATSRGTGELIAAALDAGSTRIVIGVGGSANTDGGAGVLAGLGARLLDADGAEIPDGGAALADVADVDVSGLDPRVHDTEIVLAADVDNPLLGERGAAAVFGPQKGASDEDVATLDAALAHFVDVLSAAVPGVQDLAEAAGAGAAGGVGFAALVLGAHREPGTAVVQKLTDLPAKVADADLVITGEGSLDEQSLGGKAPIGVANAAVDAGVPVIAVCGRTTLSDEAARDAGFAAVYALSDLESDVAKSMSGAAELLHRIGTTINAHAEAFAEGATP
ncbi:glycerate kinase [Paramicrobacterium agarici]|uniref:glycerate kinase n=1 Tax=Paramicrobacterium agarici TaxID=630514 RepID=UPI00114D9408|nr:glycerate kinase [Microbacterium agarici]TQO23728.1 glycerate kinase [Microbacterium agarici]